MATIIDLKHGDCLKVMEELVSKGVKFDAIITDPPYGVTRNKWDSVIDLKKMWDLIRKLSKPTTPTILFSQQPFTTTLIQSNMKEFRYDLVWDKILVSGFLNANRMPLRQHETINVFYKKLPTYNPQKTKGRKLNISKSGEINARETNNNYGKFEMKYTKNNDGMKHPKSIVKFQKPKSAVNKPTLHPTQKPVELMEWLIKTYTNEGDLVLDFTMGSGSTAVACMNTNRAFVGIEKELKYCEIALERCKVE